MPRIGIWEDRPFFSSALSSLLPDVPVIGRHPAIFSEGTFDLILIAPSASGWAGAGAVSCHLALLPGMALPLTRILQADSAISYGTASRDTLTISSLDPQQISVALQREILTLSGQTLEPQEFVLSAPEYTDPLSFLALTGARLLLTGRPE